MSRVSDTDDPRNFNVRPGIKCLHGFRSNVVSMTTFRERIIVILASGKSYRSNAKLTRWYKIAPRKGSVSKEGA